MSTSQNSIFKLSSQRNGLFSVTNIAKANYGRMTDSVPLDHATGVWAKKFPAEFPMQDAPSNVMTKSMRMNRGYSPWKIKPLYGYRFRRGAERSVNFWFDLFLIGWPMLLLSHGLFQWCEYEFHKYDHLRLP